MYLSFGKWALLDSPLLIQHFKPWMIMIGPFLFSAFVVAFATHSCFLCTLQALSPPDLQSSLSAALPLYPITVKLTFIWYPNCGFSGPSIVCSTGQVSGPVPLATLHCLGQTFTPCVCPFPTMCLSILPAHT
ncbi:hypothetical protein GQR58_029708 [Nymphon striatum]|nr:hypothetical protein GQR58_029708 [Nymphon striatum]